MLSNTNYAFVRIILISNIVRVVHPCTSVARLATKDKEFRFFIIKSAEKFINLSCHLFQCLSDLPFAIPHSTSYSFKTFAWNSLLPDWQLHSHLFHDHITYHPSAYGTVKLIISFCMQLWLVWWIMNEDGRWNDDDNNIEYNEWKKK